MVAQNPAEFSIFRGHARQGGLNFNALLKTLGKTAIAFFKIYIIPAANRNEADLFKIAAPGRKTIDFFWKKWEQKKFGNKWEVEKEIHA